VHAVRRQPKLSPVRHVTFEQRCSLCRRLYPLPQFLHSLTSGLVDADLGRDIHSLHLCHRFHSTHGAEPWHLPPFARLGSWVVASSWAPARADNGLAPTPRLHSDRPPGRGCAAGVVVAGACRYVPALPPIPVDGLQQPACVHDDRFHGAIDLPSVRVWHGCARAPGHAYGRMPGQGSTQKVASTVAKHRTQRKRRRQTSGLSLTGASKGGLECSFS
jgi:hypothetical protein